MTGDIDLAAPGHAPTGATGEPAWVTLRIGALPVTSARLPVAGRGKAFGTWLERTLDAPMVSRAVATTLARHIVESAWQGGDLGVPAALRAAHEGHRQRAEPRLGISIAICTRNRTEVLLRALASVRSRAGSVDELIVVDNTATSALDARDFPGIRLLHEPVAGLSRARNRALREATQPVVAFLDDDTVAGDGWSDAASSTMSDAPEAAVLCGLVQPLSLETEAARVVEAYGGMGRGFERKWAFAAAPQPASLMLALGNTSRMGVGANFVVRREAALALGGFDEALGAGTPTGGGEDLEFLFRTMKAGHAVCYEPAAVVLHEHRSTMDAVLSQVESWGSGMRAYLERTATAYPEERLAVRALLAWLSISWYGRRVVTSFFRPSFPREVLWRDIRGLWSGARRYRASAPTAAPPAAPRAAMEPRLPVHEALLDLREPLRNVRAPYAGAMHFHVSIGPRRLGSVTLPVLNGHVGAARLADAIASTFRRELLGAPDRQVALAFLNQLERK